jgi:hypothetical protein
LQVLEEDVDNHLEGNDDDTLQEVKDEVLNLNTVEGSDNSLIVINPNKNGEERLIDQGKCVGAEAAIVVNERLDLLGVNVIHFDSFFII